ncbi:WD domain, G-beta repeat protein, partial [Ancylostoma caninum]
MRLKVPLARTPRHLDTVAAVGWAGGEEIYSYADDHCLLRWNLSTMEASTVMEMPSTLFATSMQWYPRTGKREGSSDIFALSSTDGRIHFVNKMGKIEKSFEAHKGAALQAKWCPDGTGLLSCGEDGAVKLWSRNGMLRSVITQMPSPVYCLHPDSTSSLFARFLKKTTWVPLHVYVGMFSISCDAASDNILFSNNEYCYIKSLKTQAPPLKWKAHDGLVLCSDWCLVSEHIVTGGEDCKFKLWDRYGRSLFISISCDFPISSVAWSPDGQCFAVGSQNILRLCDKAGWPHSLEKLTSGSLLSLCWFDDSTQLVAGSGTGQVIHAQIVGRTVECGGLEVVQTKRNILEVRDLNVDLAQESLETRDRITRAALAYNQLVVVTTLQLYIYSSKNWNTPVIVDLKEKTIALILQASRKNYGSGEKVTSISNDVVAIRDRAEASTVWFFDPTSGKTLGDGKIVHEREITELTLSQCGKLSERVLAFRDSDAAVFVGRVKTYGIAQRIAKIGSSVEHLHFNDTTNMLAAVGEGRVTVWPAVEIAFVDRTLLQQSVIDKPVSGLGKFPILRRDEIIFIKTQSIFSPTLQSYYPYFRFTDNVISLRRSDGSIVTTTIPPFSGSLLQYAAQSKWDQAIRLCRHVKSETTWAILAGLATASQNIYAAEIAYGALEEVYFLTVPSDELETLQHYSTPEKLLVT